MDEALKFIDKYCEIITGFPLEGYLETYLKKVYYESASKPPKFRNKRKIKSKTIKHKMVFKWVDKPKDNHD